MVGKNGEALVRSSDAIGDHVQAVPTNHAARPFSTLCDLFFLELGDKRVCCREQLCRHIGDPLLLPLGLLALRVGCGRFFDFPRAMRSWASLIRRSVCFFNWNSPASAAVTFFAITYPL